ARAGAVGDDLAQRPGQLVGQRGDAVLLVQTFRVVPGELQAAVLDPADDVEHVCPGNVGTDVGLQPAVHRPVQAVVPEGPVELAQVVEAHLRPGAPGEGLGRGGPPGQVAQRPVPQATAGHGPELV